jgi:3-oxo-5-alpha-steroid 4-dehydrogenase 3
MEIFLKWGLRMFFIGASFAAIYAFLREDLRRTVIQHGKLAQSKQDKPPNFLESRDIIGIIKYWLLEKHIKKSNFTYFYFWAWNWNFSLLAITLGRGISDSRTVSIGVLTLFQLHFGRRYFESKYIQKYSEKSEILIGHFVFGLGFYTAVGLAVVFDTPHDVVPYHFWTPFLVACFLFANWKQHKLHCILANIRKSPSDKHSYKIPKEDWFASITTPHYTCEIIIYMCISALFDFRNVAMILCLVWVWVGLGLLSWETFQWYLGKFPAVQDRIFFNQRELLIKYIL